MSYLSDTEDKEWIKGRRNSLNVISGDKLINNDHKSKSVSLFQLPKKPNKISLDREDFNEVGLGMNRFRRIYQLLSVSPSKMVRR